MSQNSIIMPTSGTVSGLQLSENVNAALDSLNTNWSGASAPPSPEPFQLWADTTSNTMWQRNAGNTAWVALWGFGGRDADYMIGSILQLVETVDGTYASGSSVVPFDNTIPQSSETTEFTQAATAFTPKSATSTLLIELTGWFAASNAGGTPVMCLFQDSQASALATAISATPASNGYNAPCRLTFKVASGSTATRTYRLRFGASVGTTYINGGNGAPGALFGGTMLSGIRITEIEL